MEHTANDLLTVATPFLTPHRLVLATPRDFRSRRKLKNASHGMLIFNFHQLRHVARVIILHQLFLFELVPACEQKQSR